jgi:hypothetical protein
VLDHPKAQAILHNPELVQLIWATVVPDLKDVPIYLATGRSPKYDPQKLLGRWTFNVNGAMNLFRRSKSNISSTDMQKWKKWMVTAFAKTTFIAMTDHQALLKNVPQMRLPAANPPPSSGTQSLKGQWKDQDGKYQITLSDGTKDEQLDAAVEGDHLTIAGEGLGLAFDRED